jgi:hypothetical protein
MIIDVDASLYRNYFTFDPNPFISQAFIELNKKKADKILRLVDNTEKPAIGLIAGLRDGVLKSPFSAPFGGVHFRNENIYISEIESFLKSLQQYIIDQNFKGIDITLPPEIYHRNINAKLINCLVRLGFKVSTPEITNWVDLINFTGEFSQKNSREYYRQAIRNELSFRMVEDTEDKLNVYNLICENRAKFGRPIYMSFDDIVNTGQLWPADFFDVITRDGVLAASAIFYRCHPTIAYAVFWGDNELGRPLRAMDFLAYHLWNHYKKAGYSYIDLGISTEKGTPNEGLLRFKESHDATSSSRFMFSWNA